MTLLRLAGLAAVLAVSWLGPAPVLAELRGHGGPVRAIAVTPDGRLALSGSFDTSAIVWAVDLGRALTVLRGHDGAVNAAAVLPDGRFATAGEDGKVVLWRVGRPDPERVLQGHEGPVAGLAVSPDGAWLASAAWDGTVRLWPLAGGEPRVLRGHAGNVNGVAFLADGRTLASAGYDATLRLWPVAGGEPRVLTLPTALNAVAAAGPGLAAGGADGVVRLLSPTGDILAESEPIGTPVVALAAAPDGARLAAAGIRGSVTVLDTSSLRAVTTLIGPGLPVWSLAFHPDGRRLVTGGGDRLVRLWDVATGEHIGAVAPTGGGDELAAYGDDRGAQVFRACAACHTLTPDGGNRAGPTLHGVFGRRIGTAPGYAYSPALRGMDIVWTADTLRRLFEVGPSTFTPGTKMPEQTVSNAADLDALVRFLERATAPR